MDLDSLRSTAKTWLTVLGVVALFACGFGTGWYTHAALVLP